jgi:hypothetical protein
MTKKNPEPVVLELAPLPREQIGPFILLGVEKDADPEQIEANWAQRLKQTRRQQISIALEDVNWAREVVNDPEKRVRADAASLNVDTSDGVLRRLAERYGGGPGSTAWQPRDREKDLRGYEPPAEVPDAEAFRAAIVVPEPALEIPAVAVLLEGLAREVQSLDPWALELPTDDTQETAP